MLQNDLRRDCEKLLQQGITGKSDYLLAPFSGTGTKLGQGDATLPKSLAALPTREGLRDLMRAAAEKRLGITQQKSAAKPAVLGEGSLQAFRSHIDSGKSETINCIPGESGCMLSVDGTIKNPTAGVATIDLTSPAPYQIDNCLTGWRCELCTFVNDTVFSACQLCNTKKQYPDCIAID